MENAFLPDNIAKAYPALNDSRVRVFWHTLDLRTSEYFSKYDYDSWKPPKVRRDWIREWVKDGEFIDIGCGAYPVSMDVPYGKKRGVGVDIASEAAHNALNYFKEFYLFNIEKIKQEEIPELMSRFDYAIISEALEHFRDPMVILRKTLWFLKPDGKLLVTYPNAYSIAQWVDRIFHFGKRHRFRDFHRSHVFLVHKKELEEIFQRAGFKIQYFDLRPSDIIDHFPNEQSRKWRFLAKLAPDFLGHQFFYILRPVTNFK